MSSCNMSRVCQPSMVFDSSLPYQSEKTSSTDSSDNTLVENPIMVSGTPGGLPSTDSSTSRPCINATGAGLPDATGSTSIDRLAYLRQSYAS